MIKVNSPVLRGNNLTGPARSIGGPEPLKRPDNPDSFGVAPIAPGAAGRALASFGGDITRTTRTVQATLERIATTKAEQANVSFEKELRDVFFNPESGYFNTQGQNAYEGAEPTQKQIGEIRKKYSEGLDGQARNMFIRSSEAQITRADTDIMRHSSTQLNAWEAATTNALIENSLDNAAAYWNDPNRLGVQLELGRNAVIDSAQQKGLGAADVAEALENYNSQFAINMVQAALGENAAAGQTALAQNAEMFEKLDLVKMQNTVDIQFKQEEDKMESEAAVVTATSLVEQYGDQTDARTAMNEYVNNIENPSLRSKTQREVNYQFANKKAADSEYKSGVFNTAQDARLEGASVDQVIAADPAGWDALTAAQKATIMKEGPVVTNFEVFSGLSLLPTAELAKVDPYDYVDQLSTGDLNTLLTRVMGARKGGAEGAKAELGRSRTAQLKFATDRLFKPFGNSSDYSEEERDKIDAFYALATAEESYRKEQLQVEELSLDQYTTMVQELTRKEVHVRTRAGYDLLKMDDNLDISGIGAENLELYGELLRTMGLPVNSKNLVNVSVGQIEKIPLDMVKELSDELRKEGYDVNAANLLEGYRQQTTAE